MFFSWLKRRRRTQILNAPIPSHWHQILEKDIEHYKRLTQTQRKTLLEIIQVLLAEKDWVGCGGLSLTEEMKVVLAGQAGTLILAIEHDYFCNVDSILVYPDSYSIEMSAHGPLLGPEKQAVLGHAQLRGPVVLSWRHAVQGGQDADDGRNLVYHEFAHKLDMLDGVVDGTPPLKTKVQLKQWIEVMTEAYETLREQAARGKTSLIDHYGATSVGEFFACASEAYMEKGRQLRDAQPRVYALLNTVYRLDTHTWSDRF